MMVFSFFFIQEKQLFVAKNITLKLMGVIAVHFQFWFQFHRHNNTLTRHPPPTSPPPALSCCADWSGGELSVSVFCGLGMVSLAC